MSGARPFLGPALAALTTVAWVLFAVDWFRGGRRVPLLRKARSELRPLGRYPSVSVVVAARDEQASVGASLRSLLAQDYPGKLEVIAVDDRSADRTGAVLAALASKRPDRMEVVGVEILPKGWLGKNHALWLGAKKAKGEWLLFTDADVLFSPDCLEAAVTHAARENLDHLVLAPGIVARGVALKSFVTVFAFLFEASQRPWRVPDPGAREAIGVGAFNLVKKGAYQRVGTHQEIRARPDDDMKLGRILKDAGFRQGVAYGAGSVSVEWHQTLAGAVRGLEKSLFPGIDYRVSVALLGSLGLFLTNVLPFAGVFLARRGVTRFLYGLDVLLAFAMYAEGARRSGSGTSPLYAALHPFGVSALLYALLRSTYKILARGGVEWRGTFYALDDLRE